MTKHPSRSRLARAALALLLSLVAGSAVFGQTADNPVDPCNATTNLCIISFSGHVPHTWEDDGDPNDNDQIVLQGRLEKPAGAGPFPAVLVLHGSGGLWYNNREPSTAYPNGDMFGPFDMWADQLNDAGYVALFLDSFRPRDLWEFEGEVPPQDADVAPAYERSRDALDALAFLRGRTYVDPDRIAVLGFSHGGGGVVGAMVDGQAAIDEVGSGNFTVNTSQGDNPGTYTVPDPPVANANTGFRCGVSYYPGAGFFGYFGQTSNPASGFYRPYAPLLMIYGEEDDFWTVGDPEELRDKSHYWGGHGVRDTSLSLSLYEDVDHSFDIYANDDPPHADTPQALAARHETLDFLAACVDDQTPPVGQAWARFGHDSVAGDFDCDGKDDLAVGEPMRDVDGQLNAGRVTVLFAPTADEVTLPEIDASEALEMRLHAETTLTSASYNAWFGHALAAEDFDGDGCDDLAVGAPWIDDRRGAVFVYYGSDDPDLVLDPATRERLDRDDTELAGSAVAGDQFGYDLAAGDVDGDGTGDLVATTPGYLTRRGLVSALFGGTNGLDAYAVLPDERIQGSSGMPGQAETNDGNLMVLAVGDLDGDTYDDVAVGYPREDLSGWMEGYVVVIPGSASGLTTTGILGFDQSSISGETTEDYDFFGNNLAIGDVDGDSYGDLLIGSFGQDWGTAANTGVAHLVYGSSTGLDLSSATRMRAADWGDPEVERTWFAYGMAIGDFDGDGFDDVALGATDREAGGLDRAGRIYVAYGQSSGGLQFVATADPESPTEFLFDRADPLLGGPPAQDSQFGNKLAVGDWNGDGVDDLAAGAYAERVDGYHSIGTAHVLYGRRIDDGPQANWEFGLSSSGSLWLVQRP